MGSDEQAVRVAHAAWIVAVNAGDVGRLLALMADDAVFLSPGRPPVGRADFPDGFTAAHRQARIVCVSEPEGVTVVGDVAYTVSRDALTVAPHAGGGEARLAGHRLTVWRRQPDGRWLLARDAHTLTPVE